jgi:hypothetical protein
LGHPRAIVRLDDAPGAVAELVDRKRIRVGIDPLRHQERVVADLAEEVVMLRQGRQQQGEIRRP